MELDKFHVLHCTFCPVYHSYPITGGYLGICRIAVNHAGAAGCQQSYPRKDRVDLPCFGIQYICPVAGNIGSPAVDVYAQVVLGD